MFIWLFLLPFYFTIYTQLIIIYNRINYPFSKDIYLQAQMGICPALDPQIRVLQNQNHTLKQILIAQLKDLRVYNFYVPLVKTIQNIPTRYLYSQGVVQDIQKLHFYAQRKLVHSMQSRVSQYEENILEEQIKNSCLILQNEMQSDVQSKEFDEQKIKNRFKSNKREDNQGDQNQEQDNEYDHSNKQFEGTHSFQNNITRNQSLVAQLNITYGRDINRQEYSQSLKLFLKWVQYFNQHSYGGFLKPVYKSFCQSLYSLDRTQFETLVDEVSIFVQYLVKVYTEIYNLQSLNKSVDGKLFKNQNVYNLVMSFMFRKTKIKTFIRMMIRQNNIQKIKKFQQKLKHYSKKSINYFGIDKKFILIKTEEWQRAIMNKKKKYGNNFQKKDNSSKIMQNGLKSQSKIIDQNKKKYNSTRQQQQQEIQPPAFMQSFRSRVQSSCYEGSLKLVNQLSNSSGNISPITKLKIIISISKQIVKQIQHFYIHELKLPRSQIPQIDPDNLTSIIIYLIVINNQSTLFEELKIIEYFTTTNTLNCISGYYLNTFIAAIQMILEMK